MTDIDRNLALQTLHAIVSGDDVAKTDAGLLVPDGADAVCAVAKMEAAKRFTLGVAYLAESAKVHKGADGFRDFMSADELEDTAWSWMAKSRSVGLCHQDGTEGHGVPVESYIYRGPDWTIQPGVVVKAGDWLLGTRWDETAWTLIESGELNGYSPQGKARRRTPSPDRIASLRS